LNYVIGTGWWCSNTNGTEGREFGLPKVGHPVIRSQRFFNLWLYFVRRYTKPQKIIVVDSASPIKPPGFDKRDYEYVSLDRNYHSVKNTLFNGWIRGFMTGASYAWNCNCDFIYVEQDCIAVGRDWVDALYKKSDLRKPLFGSKFRSPIQQSLVFLPNKLIPKFLYLLATTIKPMNCETRFHTLSKLKGGMGYGTLPFGVGRVRPIDWKAKHLYVQHWTDAELRELGKREKVNGMINNLLTGG